jgi:alpha-beta hydrolase superfamily lysophospholipase
VGEPRKRADREGRLRGAEPSTEGFFSGQGGIEIHWQARLPERAARATVVIAHGVSEHADRYAHVAERLTGEGYAVYLLDHRGHGDSGGPRALIDRVERAVADIDILVGIARERQGGRVFLLGHSMGGALAVEYAIHHQDRIDGLLLSAPATDLEAATRFELFAARVLSNIAPRVGVYAVDATKISRDPDVVSAYEEDPRVFHDRLPARTVWQLADAIRTMPERVPGIRLPLVVMLGTADEIVPPRAGRMVHAGAGSADKRLIEYEGLYHEILNEPEQDRVMDDLVQWLDARA